MIGRRPLIAGLAAASIAPAARATSPDPLPPGGLITQVASRSALGTMNGEVGQAVLLTEAGRQGFFVLREGAVPAVDPLQGLAVPGPRGRHWARMWDGTIGYPEWFGARSEDPTAAGTNKAAVEACIALCPVTQLAAGAYFMADTLRIAVSNRTVQGAVMSLVPPSYETGSRIVCTDASKDVIRVGGPGPDAVAAVIRLIEITAIWSVDLVPPADGRESYAPAGFRVEHVLTSNLERCFVLNPIIGFRFNNAIDTRMIDYGVGRFKLYGGNDFFRGVYVQGKPRRFAGGNASLYLEDGNVTTSGELRAALRNPMGIYADADFADLYILGLETSQIAFPIVLDGAGGDYAGGHGDVHIRNLVLDQIIGDGVTIRNTNPLTKIQIDGGYIQIVDSQQRNKGLWFQDGGGAITVSNLQITGEDRSTTSIGIYLANRPNVAIGDSVIVENIAFPVTVEKGCPRLSLACTVNGGALRARGHAAVTVDGASQSLLRPKVTGAAGVWTAGIELLGSGHDRVGIDPTMVDPASISPARKVVINGRAVAASGHYAGDGNRAPEGTGVMVSGIVG
jgi:uncharacterized Zn-binding protein involved in type VI secretion